MPQSFGSLKQIFTGFDDLRIQMAYMSIDAVPLSPTDVRGVSHSLVGDKHAFTSGELHSDHRYVGSTQPHQLLLGLLIDHDREIHFGSSPASDGDLSILQPDKEYAGRVSGHLRFVSLSIDRSELEALATTIGAGDAYWYQNHHVKPPRQVRSSAGKIVRSLHRMVRSDVQLTMARTPNLLFRTLAFPFVLTAAFDDRNKQYETSQSDAAIVRKAEEWFDAQTPETLHVIDLCVALNLPLRSVQRVFHRCLGIGPARYLAMYRMARVRKELLTRDPTNLRVSEVAFDHGVWELGRFAGQYRAMFGEKPSETLARRQHAN